MNKENTNVQTEVRAVAGYDPSKLTIAIQDGSGTVSAYLEVKHRKDWFLRWCHQNNYCGLLDDSEITYNPASKMVEGKATVYVDGKVIGKSAACKPYDPDRPENNSATVFQDVGTLAMGRALANAGFGTVNCILDEGDTSSVLSDAPVVMQPSSACASMRRNQGNPMFDILDAPSGGNQVSPAPKPVAQAPATFQAPVSKKDTPRPARFGRALDIVPVSTVEEARQAIMPFGSHKGKTLGEIFATVSRKAIVYYANCGNRPFDNDGYKNLTAACRMILKAEGMLNNNESDS